MSRTQDLFHRVGGALNAGLSSRDVGDLLCASGVGGILQQQAQISRQPGHPIPLRGEDSGNPEAAGPGGVVRLVMGMGDHEHG
ncbi:MAG: hypothetical protein PVF19_15175, partial [Gemmatimonadota bacterium]